MILLFAGSSRIKEEFSSNWCSGYRKLKLEEEEEVTKGTMERKMQDEPNEATKRGTGTTTNHEEWRVLGVKGGWGYYWGQVTEENTD